VPDIREQLDNPPGKQGRASKDFQIIENGETLALTKEEMQTKFQEHFKEAERLVKETGYHRRDNELKELKVSKV
jgi:hypothetical protein